MNLWDDVRLPEEFLQFFKASGTCVNCGVKIRHELHAFHHWKRYHRVRPKKQQVQSSKFFAWERDGQRWLPVRKSMYQAAREMGIATAHTK